MFHPQEFCSLLRNLRLLTCSDWNYVWTFWEHGTYRDYLLPGGGGWGSQWTPPSLRVRRERLLSLPLSGIGWSTLILIETSRVLSTHGGFIGDLYRVLVRPPSDRGSVEGLPRPVLRVLHLFGRRSLLYTLFPSPNPKTKKRMTESSPFFTFQDESGDR